MAAIKTITNFGTVLPNLQGEQYGRADLYELASSYKPLNAEYGFFDILEPGGGGAGNGGGYGNGNGGGTSSGADAGGGAGNKDITLDDEIERYWKALQESETEKKSNNWLLYAAIAIGLFSIIK